MKSILIEKFQPVRNPDHLQDLEKADEVLAQSIAGKIQKLPRERQERLLKVLRRLKFGQSYSGKEIQGLPFLDASTLGEFVPGTPDDAHIVLQLTMRDHPLSRITLRHEFSHLSRLDAGETTSLLAKKHVQGVLRRRLGLYREELAAFGDEWDYIRTLYTKEDLPRLREAYGPLTQEKIEYLRKTGLVVFDQVNNVFRMEDPAGDPEKLRALMDFAESEYNGIFLKMVESALTNSKSEYIKKSVGIPQYRRQQSQFVFNGRMDRLMALARSGYSFGKVAGTAAFGEWLVHRVKELLQSGPEHK